MHGLIKELGLSLKKEGGEAWVEGISPRCSHGGGTTGGSSCGLGAAHAQHHPVIASSSVSILSPASVTLMALVAPTKPCPKP